MLWDLKQHNTVNIYCFKWMEKGVLMNRVNTALTEQKKTAYKVSGYSSQ